MIALGGEITSRNRPAHTHHGRRRLRQLSDDDLLSAVNIAEGDLTQAAEIAVGPLSGRQLKKELRRRGLQNEVATVRRRAKALKNARRRLERAKGHKSTG